MTKIEAVSWGLSRLQGKGLTVQELPGKTIVQGNGKRLEFMKKNGKHTGQAFIKYDVVPVPLPEGVEELKQSQKAGNARRITSAEQIEFIVGEFIKEHAQK